MNEHGIRADYDSKSVIVYQAYSKAIYIAIKLNNWHRGYRKFTKQ